LRMCRMIDLPRDAFCNTLVDLAARWHTPERLQSSVYAPPRASNARTA
jgi:hypothetical protein